MERSWWWKTFGVLLLTGLAALFLAPTVLGKDKLPGWLAKHIDAELQLGLDLQGGIHLVYEVEVEKAVSDKADRLAIDLEERLIKGKKVKVYASREGRDGIVLKLAKKSDLSVVDSKFLADYRSNLDEVARDPAQGTITLRMDEEYVNEVSEYAIRQAIETIRGRVDQFGVAEPTILRKGSDIVVELPGLTKQHFERVKKVIGRTAQLEFKICDDEADFMIKVAARVPKDSPIEVRTDSYDGKQRGSVSYTYLQAKDKKTLDAFLESLPAQGLTIPKDREILYGEERARDDKGNALPDRVWVTYYMRRRTELTGEYLTDAEVQWDDRTGRPEVGLTLDHTGASIFERVSGDNIGYRMAIILDSNVNSAPVLESRIGGGRARITLGGFRSPVELQQEATDLASVLRSGALPAPLQLSFERQIGPTLGRDAVRQGLLAFGVGGIFIILFMAYYYKGSGLLCDITLALAMIYIVAIMAGFRAALTLPGIAGLVLTLGMAVDANVIIFERVREELALGKTPRAAIDAGYGRAFWTIFDSQLTTAIAGFVLLQYGSGPIRGFAVTLLIGILCSVFCAVVVSRLLMDFVVGKFKPKTLSI